MTEFTDHSGRTRTDFHGWLLLVAFGINLFALGTVVYWIFHARARFIATHPDQVAVRPPTISLAISDPLIGEPFAVWVTLAGLCLAFGVYHNASFYRRISGFLAAPERGLRRSLLILPILIVIFQALSGVGMHVLSAYRFPHHNEMHMLGSYLFFGSQSLVILAATLLSHSLVRHSASLTELHERRLLSRRMLRLRRSLGALVVALTLLYLLLFKVKDLDLGPWDDAVYRAYIAAEPTLIVSFLAMLALFQTDLLAFRRARALP